MSLPTPTTGAALRLFAAFLAHFHLSEFAFALRFNPQDVSTRSFLLSRPYAAAMTCGVIEFAASSALMPERKASLVRGTFYLGAFMCVFGEWLRKSAMCTAGAAFTHLIQTRRRATHVLVTEGENLVVPLKARGVGTTMHCDHDLTLIDFGSQFTSTTCERTFLLENKGRRAQTLSWVNVTVKEKEAAAKKKLAAKLKKLAAKGGPQGGARNAKKELPQIVPVFTVEPEQVDLKPRTACLFHFRGLSANVGELTERLECLSKVNKEKKDKHCKKERQDEEQDARVRRRQLGARVAAGARGRQPRGRLRHWRLADGGRDTRAAA